MTKKITTKQEGFAQSTLVEDNASEAYRKNYNTKGMNAASINREAQRLMDNPKVATRIAELKVRREEKTGVDAEWLLKRLALEAEADVADLYDDNGHVKSIHEWPLIWRQGLVGGMDVTQEFETVDGKREAVGAVTKLKISDRVKRLELIGKHVDVQAFLERKEVKALVTFPALMGELYGNDKPQE